MLENQNCCRVCWHSLAKEFQINRFGLSHEPTDEFFKSQWQKGDKSLTFLIYRWCMAICFSIGVIGGMESEFNQGKWFIYLTDWGFFLCMYINIFSAILASIYFFDPSTIVNCKGFLKFYWLSHFSTLVLATVITVIYWSFLYPTDSASATALYNLWAHGFNSILMVLDQMIVAFPTRILHFIYPMIVALLYLFFTIIYYFSGGLDPSGHYAIYPILDWKKPAHSVITALAAFLFLVLLSLLMFYLYKLRYWIYCKVNRTSLKINA